MRLKKFLVVKKEPFKDFESWEWQSFSSFEDANRFFQKDNLKPVWKGIFTKIKTGYDWNDRFYHQYESKELNGITIYIGSGGDSFDVLENDRKIKLYPRKSF